MRYPAEHEILLIADKGYLAIIIMKVNISLP